LKERPTSTSCYDGEKVFKPLVDIPESVLKLNELLTLRSVQLHYQLAYLTLSCLLASGAVNIRQFMPIFSEILILGKVIVAHPFIAGAENTFTADIQFIHATFLVAARYPHRPQMPHQAET
jgi:hypothetical protein